MTGKKVNIMSLTIEQLGWLINCIRFITIAATLYFLKWPPFIKERSRLSALLELSYILAVAPLIFPHQQHYSFVYFIPASTTLLYYFFTAKFTSVQ